MEDFITARDKINRMSQLTLFMLRNTFAGFMEHDLDILAAVLKDEEKLNDMNKDITLSVVEISKGKASLEKKNLMLLATIAADLEEIGDYIKDMIERIEIKIQERLFFSEDALTEYKHLYHVVETELSDIDKSLKLNDKNFAKRVLCNEEHVDNLVERYRNAHAQRLLAGICDPRACNMFLNLLDFTAQISHHTRAVAKNIIELT